LSGNRESPEGSHGSAMKMKNLWRCTARRVFLQTGESVSSISSKRGMGTVEEILKILQEIRPDVDFVNEKKLIDGEVLDSFDIITIVAEFNDAFNIDIDVEDLEPENFNSIEAMEELIKKLQKE
jgi:acyl carrier protein